MSLSNFLGVRQHLLDAMALLWPTSCASCGVADRDLCDECYARLTAVRSVGEHLAPGLGACFYASEYEGALQNMIVALKHEERLWFAKPLALMLQPVLDRALRLCEEEPLIVLLPSRRKKERERGFNHLELIAQRALSGLGLKKGVLKPRVLCATRGRTGQVGLLAAERFENAARIRVAKRFQEVLKNRDVILVDDILTTGASLTKAKEELEKYGARVRASCVLGIVITRSAKVHLKHARQIV